MERKISKFVFEYTNDNDKIGWNGIFGKGNCVAILSKATNEISLFSFGTKVLSVNEDGTKIYCHYKSFKDQSQMTRKHIKQFLKDHKFENNNIFKDATSIEKKLEEAPLVIECIQK